MKMLLSAILLALGSSAEEGRYDTQARMNSAGEYFRAHHPGVDWKVGIATGIPEDMFIFFSVYEFCQ
jgi:hypothetical protein